MPNPAHLSRPTRRSPRKQVAQGAIRATLEQALHGTPYVAVESAKQVIEDLAKGSHYDTSTTGDFGYAAIQNSTVPEPFPDPACLDISTS